MELSEGMIETVTQERAIKADPMIPTPAVIRRIVWETDDTFTLILGKNGLGTFAFSPGQFNMLSLFGVGEAAISISSDPERPNTISHTIHRVGIVTTRLAQMKRGNVIGLRGPFGSSWPQDVARGKDICIVAGGIGLAPLRPLVYSLWKNRSSFGRIFVLYGARSPLDLLYRVELEEWGTGHNAEVLVTVDRSDTSWKGHIGVVTSLFSYVKLDPRNTIAYVCGPETMMKFTVEELSRQGLSDDQVYLSLERNMKCAIGLCGHCQVGPLFVCKDGPVFPLVRVRHLLKKKEL